MAEKTLVERTHDLLDESDLTWKEICAGAEVGYHWLNKFAGRHFKNPGADRVERLHNFLAEQKAPA